MVATQDATRDRGFPVVACKSTLWATFCGFCRCAVALLPLHNRCMSGAETLKENPEETLKRDLSSGYLFRSFYRGHLVRVASLYLSSGGVLVIVAPLALPEWL